jgi:dihydropteroate synthase
MLQARDRVVRWTRRPLLMGVVNANADSFSDPGPRTRDGVVAAALRLADEGALILDLGAQSAITGRPPVDAAEEAAALAPVVRDLAAARPEVLLSVDTWKRPVVEACLEAGAHIVNDVSGLRDPGVASACAAVGAALVVMHTAAPPLTRLQDQERYGDVAAEVARFLAERVEEAVAAGVGRSSIVVDPGVDFTKTPAQSVALLRGLGPVVALGHPVLLALSRKDFVGALTGRAPSERGAGTLGAVAALRHVPNLILRVHDVAATADVLAVFDAVSGLSEVDAGLALAEHLRHERPRRALSNGSPAPQPNA